MTFLAQLAQASLLVFVLLLFGSQCVAREIGLYVGRRRLTRGTVNLEGVNAIVGGMLGLLAFVLALTLTNANTRFQERREAIFAEANAIGGAWSRAEAIGQPRALAIARLLEEYLHVRRAYIEAPEDAAAVAELDSQSERLQGELWGHVAAIIREQPNPVSVALMNAVDGAVDGASRVRFAFSSHLPAQLFWALLGMTLLGMGALGYQIGLRGQTLRLLSLLLVGMWTVVIIEVLDLSSPRIGSMRHEATPYDWVEHGFAGGLPIPPLPAQ